jgi:UDP-N-acetyl-D-glucosamine/UDP-N-acetyl-D-galactosamine dehydrogenase
MKIKVGVIGLGYVGLPLIYLFLKRKVEVIGFDINKQKIEKIRKGFDSTNQLSKKEISFLKNRVTNNIKDLEKCNIFIVTVPTPVKKNKLPDLSPLKKACLLISKILKNRDIVIFESTSFPGTTEDICGNILKQKTGLNFAINDKFEKKLKKNKVNFFYLGYSPERVNPGDNSHKLENIKKIVSSSTKSSLKIINNLYKSIIKAGTYKAESIKIAEAAKVIENTQRDLNIALFNELSKIFHHLKLDSQKIINAAATKWNFHKYEPGLVGGHCISTDPYYLTHIAKSKGYNPKIILAGRKLNDKMYLWVVKKILEICKNKKIKINKSKVIIFGVTFKEDCPDTRNSQSINISMNLKQKGADVSIYDPYLNKNKYLETKKINILSKFPNINKKYDIVIILVKHRQFLKKSKKYFYKIRKNKSILIDIKNILDSQDVDFKL